MDYTVHGLLQARILEWVAFPFSRDLPNPGIKPRSPILHADSLPAEPQGKPKNTGVSSLSLLHWIYLLDPGMELGSPELQVDSLPTELFKARPCALLTEFSLLNLIELDFCFTIYSVEKVSIQRNPNMNSCID